MDALTDSDPPQIGPYSLLGRLGHGGMGVVYLAHDETGTRVAVKVIHRHLAADPEFRRRFGREVAAAQRVARFCTAPVLTADVDGTLAYLVTEFVSGPDLEKAVESDGPMTGSSLDGLAASVAVALRAIHGAGVIHRDLKPSNVLLSPVGPKVIDFGVAHLTDNRGHVSSTVIGTPAYMSPEQVGGETITPASDVFAWGGVMAFAASGHGPFGTGSIPTVLYRVVHHEPDLSGLHGHLRDLVVAALAKNPADRPTPQDLLDALSASTTGGGSALAFGAASPAADAMGTGHPDADSADAGATGIVAKMADVAGTGPSAVDTAGADAAETGAEQDKSSHRAVPRLLHGKRLWAGVGAAAVTLAVAAAVIIPQLAPGNRPIGSSPEISPSLESSPGTVTTGPATNATATGPAVNPTATSPTATAVNPTATDPASAVSDSGPNPLDDKDIRLFAPPDSEAAQQAATWAAAGRSEDAGLLDAFAKVPQAVWVGGTASEARRIISANLTLAARTGSVPVFVTYHIPFRNCQKTGGAKDSSAYHSWIREVVKEIGDASAVVILEPESLVKIPGTNGCDLKDDDGERNRLNELSYAVRHLADLPHTAVYLDGGIPGWPSLDRIGHRLVKARIDRADGFFLNVTTYQATERLVTYGTRLAKCIHVQLRTGTEDCLDAEIAAAPDDPSALPHFVIDTGRNGQGEWVPDKKYPKPQTWCNPPGRGVGLRTVTATGNELVDAYLWIAQPGVSNGECLRGTRGPEDPAYGKVIPYGGQWWAEMALDRAKRANPPLL